MEEFDLIDLLKYFWKNIKWMIGITLLVLLLGTMYLLFLKTPLYQSSTTLILVQSSTNKEDASLTQAEITMNQKLVSTYSEIIKSRRILDEVIENLNLKQTTTELNNHVAVNAVEDTEIIKISVSDEDQKQARDIANEIAKVFSKEIAEIYNMENISVIDEANLSDRPYNIQPVKQEILFFGIGILLSGGILFFAYYFDTKVKNADQIEDKLQLTVLGTIPSVNLKKGGESL